MGDQISGNVVENVQGADIVRGICMLDASGQIDGNQVSSVVAATGTPYSNAAVGIYLDSFDIPGVTASIDANTVSGAAIGINVMGLDNPSDITGNTSPCPPADGVFGIVVRDMETVGWAPEPVAEDGVAMTVASNQIDASGFDRHGHLSLRQSRSEQPGPGPEQHRRQRRRSRSVGIDVSDDGSPFGDSTLAADYATLSG